VNCLKGAECFDAWRIVPRIVLFAYGCWLAYITDRLLGWYMSLPAAAQTAQASGFCFGAIAAVTTVGGYVFRIYSDSSRDWSKEGNRTSTLVSTETVSK
jgi:hypothetical protein